LVENIKVDYYGTPTELRALASISVPEARVLLIQPYDKNSLQDVEKAILKSDQGLVPNNDGTAVRINIPQLTEERRRDLVKLVGRRVEESNVAIRNIRRDSLQQLRTMEKDKDISQDEFRVLQEQLQKITDSFIDRVNEHRVMKESEMMEI
jgi:ribosome recycling factor